MPVPYTFGTATTSIPLSNLDANFNTPVTIGNATVGLGNTVTTVGNLTLTNATISSGNVTVTTGIFGAGSNTAPSITTTGDTNTGIFFPAADTIAFTEGGVESMRIDSSGNLGLGTASPNGKLDVTSTSAGANTNTLFLNNLSSNASTATSLVFGVSTAPTIRNATIQAINAGGNAINLAFLTSDGDAPAERMRITSAGNVGIGTSSPSKLLDVAGNAAITGTGVLSLQRPIVPTFGQGTPQLVFQYYTTGTTYTTGAQIQGIADGSWSSTSAPTNMLFYTCPSASTTILERMRITSGGNVGIGTASPSHKFHVYDAAEATIGYFHSGGGAVYLRFGNTSAQDGYIGYESTGGNQMTFYTANAERMRLTNGGNLLVGTTSVPNSGTAISCFGNVYAFALNSGTNTWYQGTNGNEFNVYSADGVRRGYLTLAGTWTNTSDIAYKKDIVDIKYSLEDALKLRPVSYLTKDHDIPQIGFIAQEMEQVIPEVVSGEEGSKGISYGSLVALCVKAIQEQQALIENLTTRLNALEGN